MFNCVKVFQANRIWFIAPSVAEAEYLIRAIHPEYKELTNPCGIRVDWAFVENAGF